MKDTLRIAAPFHASSGYSKHARALLKCALAAGYTVQAIESDNATYVDVSYDGKGREVARRHTGPVTSLTAVPEQQQEELKRALSTRVEDGAPLIILQLPMAIRKWTEEIPGPHIGYTMLECDGVRPEVAQAMECVDLMLTPSAYVTNVFRNHLGCPVKTLHEPVDTRLFTGSCNPDRNCHPPFIFLAVGTTHERKHWREMLHAFAEEFTGEDVGLVWKANRSEDALNLAAACRSYGANVKVIVDRYSEEQMEALYRSCDCFVGVGHEGFGIPFLEAALCGLPSIALDTGGQADLVTAETGWLVPSVMVPSIGLHPKYFSSSFNWASCTVPALRRVMRKAYEDRGSPGVLYMKGSMAQARARKEFTPKALAPRLRELVESARK